MSGSRSGIDDSSSRPTIDTWLDILKTLNSDVAMKRLIACSA